MKKLMLFLSVIASISLTLNTSVNAQTNSSFYVNNAYLKAKGLYDVVVHDSIRGSLKVYVNDKNPVAAKVNKQGWVTFQKVKLSGIGKLSFTKSIKTKFVAINYAKYYDTSNDQIKLYDNIFASSQTSTNTLAKRTKTESCQITPNMEQDNACTPGAIFTEVTKDMVCKSGYSSSIRNVSNSTKSQVYSEYGITTHASGQYEVDHLIPLELGGTNDIANLWPEAAIPTPGFHEKDKVENYLHSQVCAGKITLANAQYQEVSNWVQVYVSLFPAPKVPNIISPEPKITQVPVTITPSLPTTPSTNSSGTVKKSKSNICHAPGTTYYDRTTNFTPYNTIDECLGSGGRLPLR